jgi:cytochrome c553
MKDHGQSGQPGLRTSGVLRLRLALGVLAVCVPVLMAAGAVHAQGASGDPRAAKARLVLETHCARCHQRERLDRPAPAGDLGDILDLERIASDPGLVVPGNADASPLYTLMLRKEMPPGPPIEAAPVELPVAADVEALRDWIEALPPARPCVADSRITPSAVMASVAEALEKAGSAAGDLRFVSLAHLSNGCAPDRVLEGYRQAVAKLLNSLSWAPAPMRPAAIGERGTVLAVRLSELGWSAADWGKLTAGNPGAAMPAAALNDKAGEGVSLVVPGDWLAARSLSPQVYDQALRLAPTLDEQLKSLGIDRGKPDSAIPVRRIGLRSSQMTRGPRVIEHWARPGGSVWLVYDFAGSDGARDLLARPLGPLTTPPEAQPFRPDAARLMLALPNGFMAFAAYDADGKRVDAVPADLPPPAMASISDRRAAASCLSCHDGGVRKTADTLREAVLASPLPKTVRDAVAAAHLEGGESDQIFATESLRFRAALRAAGVDPEFRIEGNEPVTALARAYTRPVTLARLAEDMGDSPATLRRRLAETGADAALLAERLDRGAIPRAEAVRLAGLLAPSAEPRGETEPGPLLDLALLADKTRYVVGDTATFTIRPSFDCNLTVISINGAGKATVLFPNDFEQDNALKAGTVLRIPADASPYRLRLTQPGTERVVGVCTSQSKMADGIRQDYEKQRFTALGDWRNFLRAIVDDETPDVSSQDKAEARSRGKAPPARNAKKEIEAPKRIRLEPQARAAIDFVVDEKR